MAFNFQAMRNSNLKMVQLDLEGKPHPNQCVLVGFFTLGQIRQTNNLKRPNAWFFMFKKFPAERLCANEHNVGRQPEPEQTTLGSIVFSHSPESEQEKTRRPILMGSNFMLIDKNFYTELTITYHSTIRNHKINRL